MNHPTTTRVAAILGAALLLAALAGIARAERFAAWQAPQKIDEMTGNSSELNTAYLDGCPIQSPDGLDLYMASNRPRFAGDARTDLDIWVAHRDGPDSPLGPPENLGSPVNSTADDFCPTPIGGHRLFFVSRRAGPGSCGGSDIFFTQLKRGRGRSDADQLACQADGGPNSSADEMSPSYVGTEREAFLYFSSGPDLYVSEQLRHGRFGPATPLAELNSAAGDFRPNVRADGLEIVFDSNRAGTRGGQDLYSASRAGLHDPWSAPVNLGDLVNTDRNETRASFGSDGTSLVFGRAPGPEGSTDIYLTKRDRLTG
jgi:hypothetical protein